MTDADETDVDVAQLTPTPTDETASARRPTRAERADERDRTRRDLSAVRVLRDIKHKGVFWPGE